MRNGNLAALLMALTMALRGASTDAAEAPAPKVGHDPGANAALQYWQAFALMPALDTKQQKRLQEWDKDPTPPTPARLAGGISLACWLLVFVFGRWTGFTVMPA